VVAHGTVLRAVVKIGDKIRINRPSFLTACRIGRYCVVAGPLTLRFKNQDVHALALKPHTQTDLARNKKAKHGYACSGAPLIIAIGSEIV
jgi:hypothetical protein